MGFRPVDYTAMLGMAKTEDVGSRITSLVVAYGAEPASTESVSRQGAITKAGDGHVHNILVEAALKAHSDGVANPWLESWPDSSRASLATHMQPL